ncbi:MAG: TIGR01212 family radical SAM protein [Eubacterium sp.]|nr:TIGR01212 family radical SAM protein [Eubacterium sp.]
MWGEKPYHSLDFELKERFSEKVYKIALEGGFTCPNRDGTLDSRGCIFCSASGSGDFASPESDSIITQINNGIAGLKNAKSVGNKFIAYFQSFTNTYAPIDILRKKYMEALSHPDIVMLSIATRPDCLGDDVLQLIKECNDIKPTIVELGLQTIHEKTAEYIRRKYELYVYDKAVSDLHSIGVEVVTHVIVGLPGEDREAFLETVRYVGKLTDGIKLQLLHVLEGTDLADDYRAGRFQTLEFEEYCNLIVDALSILPENVIIHRLTGDGPKRLLISPTWSSRKRQVLNTIHKRLKETNTWQGKYYEHE